MFGGGEWILVNEASCSKIAGLGSSSLKCVSNLWRETTDPDL